MHDSVVFLLLITILVLDFIIDASVNLGFERINLNERII